MRVLIVAAHPDDELLGLGGTVVRHVEDGAEVTVVIASEGASARYDAGTETILQRDCRRAARVMGVHEVRFLGLPDQRLDTIPLLEVTQMVERARADIQPELVYTHHWGDLNRDHRVVSEATFVACRPVERGPRRLLCFETPSATEWSAPDASTAFVPTTFVDITATLDRKLEAMGCYETELRPAPHPRSLESLRARAAYWGQVSGRPYAEAFVVGREIV